MKLRLDANGLVAGVRYIASPNCDARPAGCAIDLLVIHHISLPPGEFGGPGIVDLFTNRLEPAAHPAYAGLAGLRVSSHFLIRRDGEIMQFVPCAKRAWHAGESSWKGRGRCNDFSIGIEIEGTGAIPYTDAQYERLVALTRALKARYAIADIVGHSDVAPGRKADPGPHFDWARYRALLRDKAASQRTRRVQRKNWNRAAKRAKAAKKRTTKLRTTKLPRRGETATRK